MNASNPYIKPAILTTRKLQLIIRKLVEREKDLKDAVNSTDYPAQVVKQFFKKEEVELEDETQLLAIVDQLLYRLYDYDRDSDAWHDEQNFDQRTQLKLKEILML